MTKEKLSEYNDVLVEIAKLEKRIKKLEKQSDMVSDVVQNGYKRHAVLRGVDCKRAHNLNTLREKLEERKNRLLDLKIEIEDFIKNIPNSKTRQIFEHRYLDGMEWHEVAFEMGFNGESAPRNRHDRYLEKFF